MNRHPLLRNAARAALLGTVLQACSTPSEAPPVPRDAIPPAPVCYQLAFDDVDAETALALEPLLFAAIEDVEAFFGAPFARSFLVEVFPDRAALEASFPPEWGLARTECWMVASGVADGVRILSPRVWRSEACEHDPDDALHVRRLLAHELVHVYHGQHNPSGDFVDVTGIDWFAEGLATFASGQLDDARQLSARDALANDAGPSSLATAWTGKYRYGVSGSLVAYVEHELGRERLLALLGATTGEELLDAIGRDEEELLTGWREWVGGEERNHRDTEGTED